MILRGLSRPMGLLVVFAAAFAVAVVFGPLALLPVLFEEPKAVEGYFRYLKYLVMLAWADDLVRGEAWIMVAIAAIWAGLQAAFLSPIVGKPRLESQGRSLNLSLLSAAFIGSLGCAFLWVGAIEAMYAVFSADSDAFGERYGQVVGAGYLTAIFVWIGGGFVWFLLLSRAGSMRNPAGLDRFIRWLFAGTCVELVLGVAFYLSVRRKTDCYCAMASFWNLVFGLSTLLWMCGPWAVLLVTRGERLQWARGACTQCGYPRRTGATVCPECGAQATVPAGSSPLNG